MYCQELISSTLLCGAYKLLVLHSIIFDEGTFSWYNILLMGRSKVTTGIKLSFQVCNCNVITPEKIQLNVSDGEYDIIPHPS